MSAIDNVIAFHEKRKAEYEKNDWLGLLSEEIVRLEELKKLKAAGVK